MTSQVEAGYISSTSPKRTKAEGQATWEQMVSLLKELPGGTSEAAVIALSSDSFNVIDNYSRFLVDTEAAASSDNLRTIGGTPRDGMLICVSLYNAGRPITVKHNDGGTGQIMLIRGRDLVLRKLKRPLWLLWESANNLWREVLPESIDLLERILGSRPVSTISVAAGSCVPTRANHKITASGAQNLDLIDQTNYPDDDSSILLLTTAVGSGAITVRHNQTGTGKILLRNSTNFVLPVGGTLVLYKDGTTWVEIGRFGFADLPASAQGKLAVGGLNGWTVLDAPTADGQTLRSNSALDNKMEWAANAAGTFTPATNGRRLTVSSTNPEPVGDTLGAATIYSLPYKHNYLMLYDGSSTWLKKAGTSKSLSITADPFRICSVYAKSTGGNDTDWDLEIDPWDGTRVSSTITAATAASPCVITLTSATGFNVGDVIGIAKGTATGNGWTDAKMGLGGKLFYVSAKSGNTLTLEGCNTTSLTFSTFTGATAYRIPATPDTDIVRQDGVWVKSGATTRRYLGVYFTNESGTVDDAPSTAYGKAMLANVDNVKTKYVRCIEPGPGNNSGWTTTANTGVPRSDSLALGVVRVQFVMALSDEVPVLYKETGGTYAGVNGASFNRVKAFTQTGAYTDPAILAVPGRGDRYAGRKAKYLSKGLVFAQMMASGLGGYSNSYFGHSDQPTGAGQYGGAECGMEVEVMQ